MKNLTKRERKLHNFVKSATFIVVSRLMVFGMDAIKNLFAQPLEVI